MSKKIQTIKHLFKRLNLPVELIAGDPHIALHSAYPGKKLPSDVMANNPAAIDVVFWSQFSENPGWLKVNPKGYEKYILNLLRTRKEKYGSSSTEEVILYAQEREFPYGFGHPVYYSNGSIAHAFVRARYREGTEDIEICVVKVVRNKKEGEEAYLTIPEIADLLFPD